MLGEQNSVHVSNQLTPSINRLSEFRHLSPSNKSKTSEYKASHPLVSKDRQVGHFFAKCKLSGVIFYSDVFWGPTCLNQ